MICGPDFSSKRNDSTGDSHAHTSAALRAITSASVAALPVIDQAGTIVRPSTDHDPDTALPIPDAFWAPTNGSRGRPMSSSAVANADVASRESNPAVGAANRRNG